MMLPNDVQRCLALDLMTLGACDKRENCARYTQRDGAADGAALPYSNWCCSPGSNDKLIPIVPAANT